MAQTQRHLWNCKTKFNATITAEGIYFHESPVAQWAENIEVTQIKAFLIVDQIFG